MYKFGSKISFSQLKKKDIELVVQKEKPINYPGEIQLFVTLRPGRDGLSKKLLHVINDVLRPGLSRQQGLGTGFCAHIGVSVGPALPHLFMRQQ